MRALGFALAFFVASMAFRYLSPFTARWQFDENDASVNVLLSILFASLGMLAAIIGFVSVLFDR